MHLRSALVSSFLFGAAILAAPARENAQLQIRARTEQSYAGAIITKDNNTFRGVRGIFTIPRVVGKPGYAGRAWVGIDGFGACNVTTPRGGIEFEVTKDGPAYRVFTQLGPPAVGYHSMSISTGDTLSVSVSTDPSGNSSNVEIVNMSQAEAIFIVQEYGNLPEPCLQSAGWVVDAFQPVYSMFFDTLADFGRVEFQNCSAYGLDGSVLAPGDAAFAYNIEQEQQFQTFTVVNGSTVTVLRP